MAQKELFGAALSDAVRLDEFNFAEIVKGLPAKARMVLSAAMNLPRGSLKVRLPDGRAVLVGGKG
ncbi:SAM-dependent methyltransferase, partial [Mesorhizobium sp. M7A.F.Ca.CA.001.14.1.1]